MCGLFDRRDVVKHVHTPMISWHGQTGTVFCVDIQPLKAGSLQRVATAGSDNNVQVVSGCALRNMLHFTSQLILPAFFLLRV